MGLTECSVPKQGSLYIRPTDTQTPEQEVQVGVNDHRIHCVMHTASSSSCQLDRIKEQTAEGPAE